MLAECGIRFDSSLFPVVNYRYGFPGVPEGNPSGFAPDWSNSPFPPWRFGGRNIPIAGGAYFRLFPYTFTRVRPAADQSIRAGCGVLYPSVGARPRPPAFEPGRTHPRPPLPAALSQTVPRLRNLLRDFRFGTVSQVLGATDISEIVRRGRRRRCERPDHGAHLCRPGAALLRSAKRSVSTRSTRIGRTFPRQIVDLLFHRVIHRRFALTFEQCGAVDGKTGSRGGLRLRPVRRRICATGSPEVVGLDLAPAMIEIARKAAAEAGVGRPCPPGNRRLHRTGRHRIPSIFPSVSACLITFQILARCSPKCAGLPRGKGFSAFRSAGQCARCRGGCG